MAARLAISRAQRQLAEEAGLLLSIRKFCVINMVAAVSLQSSFNCEEFVKDHSSEAHFDPQSFVGLAWRPAGEPICCEIYPTGRANLPGARTERDMVDAWSRMIGVLLKYRLSPGDQAPNMSDTTRIKTTPKKRRNQGASATENYRQHESDDVANAQAVGDTGYFSEDDVVFDDSVFDSLGL